MKQRKQRNDSRRLKNGDADQDAQMDNEDKSSQIEDRDHCCFCHKAIKISGVNQESPSDPSSTVQYARLIPNKSLNDLVTNQVKRSLKNYSDDELNRQLKEKKLFEKMVHQELKRRKEEIDKKEDSQRMGQLEQNQIMSSNNNELLNLQQHQLIKSINESTRFFVLQIQGKEIPGLSKSGSFRRHIVKYACHQQRIPLSLLAFERLIMSQDLDDQASNIIVFLKVVEEDSLFGAFEIEGNDLKTRWIQVSTELRKQQSTNYPPEWAYLSNKPIIDVCPAKRLSGA